MGVMPCCRKNCDNILCNYYSDDYGYLCSECYEELERRQIVDIEKFMDSDKNKEKLKPKFNSPLIKWIDNNKYVLRKRDDK